MWVVHLALGLTALYAAIITAMYFAQTWLLFPTALARAAAVRPPTTKAMNARWAGSEANIRTVPINPHKQPVAVAPTVKRKAQLADASAGCGVRLYRQKSSNRAEITTTGPSNTKPAWIETS